MQMTMKFSKSTKGTHVYIAEDDSSAVSTLYVKKSALQDDIPKQVTVTIIPMAVVSEA